MSLALPSPSKSSNLHDERGHIACECGRHEEDQSGAEKKSKRRDFVGRGEKSVNWKRDVVIFHLGQPRRYIYERN